MTNPLFDDLNKKAESVIPEPEVNVPLEPIVSEEEVSQIRQRQIALMKEPQVISIAQRIDAKNQIAILELGKETATGISSFSDRMLSTIKQSDLNKSTVLLTNLNKVMDRFDPTDFQEEKKNEGFLKRLFSKGKQQLENILAKYDTMNKEVDVIFTEIQKYEIEMKRNTVQLENMYDENLDYFRQLSEFVAAIDLKVADLETKLVTLSADAEQGNQIAAMELESTKSAIELLKQRGYDLEMAQQVSFQSAPQIRLMQQGNNHLIGKINSAFVTTIPIFKQGLIHAVTIQRQRLVSDSMEELDKRTNEMLLKNADNVRKTSVDLARRASSPSIKIETIEQTWQTIMSGIEEVKQVQEQTAREREEGRQRIEKLQLQYEKLKQK